jgi:hypothetical protein
MRQKPKTIKIRGQTHKIFIFFFISKSHTQMGLVCAKIASKKFSRLGTFKPVKVVTVAECATFEQFYDEFL